MKLKNRKKSKSNKNIRETQTKAKLRQLRDNIDLIKEEVCGETIVPKFDKKGNSNKIKKVEKKVEQLEKEFLEFYDEIMTSISVVHENQKNYLKTENVGNKIKKNSLDLKALKTEQNKLERKLKNFK